ncbi:hypothetical protein HA402_004186 [Bradysia odoriphaga]|nr:hypothetical protein HA402_004186 [Bradysia odoriphaga]
MKMEQIVEVEAKKDRKTTLMVNREKERQQNRENALKSKANTNAEEEDRDLFRETFEKRVREVEENLENMQPGDTKNLSKQLYDASGAIQELQNYLSNSTLFLPDYNVKGYQGIISKLVTNLENTKTKLLPKKKFGFKAKPLVTTITDTPLLKPLKNISTKAQNVDWTVQNRANEEILLQNDETNNKDLTMSTLTTCLIIIKGHPGSLQLSNLKKCLIVCGPVSRSIFADNCEDCTFTFGCQQLRLHSSKDCSLYMHVTCRAIIEDCVNISVAPFNYTYDNIDIDFMKAGLDIKVNNWEDVADFNWLSTDKASPNWKKLRVDERIVDFDELISSFRQLIS